VIVQLAQLIMVSKSASLDTMTGFCTNQVFFKCFLNVSVHMQLHHEPLLVAITQLATTSFYYCMWQFCKSLLSNCFNLVTVYNSATHLST